MSEIRQAVWDALEQFWNDVRNALEQVIVTVLIVPLEQVIVIVHRAARRAFGYKLGEQAAPQGEEKAVEETPGSMRCSQCAQAARAALLQGEEKAVEETPGRRIISGIISEGSYRSAHRLPACYMGYGYSLVPDPWVGWYEARERYAKPGSNDAAREVAMADLLSYVTARECYAEPGSNDAADNPPAADPLPVVHRPVPPSRVPRWSALSLGLAGWEFLVFGLAVYRPLLIVAMCCFVSAVMICFGWWERF